ncbi:unnamed protein product [Strongylus vulgaris]|uniref:Uncharacterized protein n=1 Tax=Strongylus vulgaris TaxID=40348 RepID=A0A3P7KUE9_STRVU|nr:unnamed protein product [Strongylus vulgaris]
MLRVLTSSQRLLSSVWKRALSSAPSKPSAPSTTTPQEDPQPLGEESTASETEPVVEKEQEFAPRHTEKYSVDAITHLK